MKNKKTFVYNLNLKKMKYVIFELVQPSMLDESSYIDYGYRTIQNSVLQEVYKIESSHDSMESAVLAIQQNNELLKGRSLTILPIFNILLTGKIE